MTTQYYTASSIDGFIADPDNSLEWLFQFSDPSGMEDQYPKFIAQVGAIAMGSTTYEWIADYTGFLNDPSKWEYDLPAWVFSSRELPRVEGPDIRFVSGDVAPVHEEMVRTAEGRNVWLVGGGDLVGQFHDQGLLDEVIIGVASVPRCRCAFAATKDRDAATSASRSDRVWRGLRDAPLRRAKGLGAMTSGRQSAIN
jgi:dihydrofolate reductase